MAQVRPFDAVPFITQVSPPSLPMSDTAPGAGNFTLTIAGANFQPNAVVNLTLPGRVIVHPFNTSVNQNGSRIVADFSGVFLNGGATLVVSVSNPGVTLSTTSNAIALPVTQPSLGVALTPSATPVAGTPKAIVHGDFAGTGSPGLAVVSAAVNTVTIFSSDGSGQLTPGASYATGQQPSGIVAADLLGNGLSDLAITNALDNSISVVLANGDGSFRPGPTIALPVPLPGGYPTGIVAGDFNRDGRIDLAVVETCGMSSQCFPVAEPQGNGVIAILLGNGDGTFAPGQTLATGRVPYALATADFNNDGLLDLVVANSGDSTVSVFMGSGDGEFAPTTLLPPFSGTTPLAISVGDFDGDGALDLAVANSGENTVAILINQGCPKVSPTQCTFAPVLNSVPVGAGPAAIATADLNGDGALDLAVADSNGASVTILLGNGAGAFQRIGANDFSTDASPVTLAIDDFNGDGRLDVVTGNGAGSLTMLRQASEPQVSLTTSVDAPTYGQTVFFTATVTPPAGQPAPTGTISFFDGAAPIGTASLDSNPVFFQYAGLAAGTHQVTAVYNGDASFGASTSNAVTESVQQAQSSTTVIADLNTVSYGQAVVLTATILPQISGTASGPVSFNDFSTSTNLGQVVPVGNVAHLTTSTLSPGAHPIVAIFQGDANLASSNSPSYTVNVVRASTSTTLSTSASPATFGQTVTLTATVVPGSGSGETGLVAFQEGATMLGIVDVSGGRAQFSTSSFSAGSHVITASYSGDGNFSGSTSGAVTETVVAAPSSTALTSSLNPAVAGQVVTFTATVASAAGTAAGTVNFFLDGGGSPAASVAVSAGAAQFSTNALAAGAHTVSATFVSGNPNIQGSSASPITQTIQDFAIASSTSALTISRGRSDTFTLTVSPLSGFTGAVAFTCSGVAASDTCTVSPPQLVLSGSGARQATVTVTIAHKSQSGTRTLTLTGSAGSLSHAVTVQLTIR